MTERTDANLDAAPTDSVDRPTTGLGRAGPVAVIATLLPITGGLVTIAVGPWAAAWLRGQGPAGPVYFTLALPLLVTLAVAPTYATSAIAGWTFGFRTGFPCVVIGTVVGGTLCYLAARRWAADRVADAFRLHPKSDLVRRALVEGGTLKMFWIIFLMRLSPALPFGTTNVLMGTTGVPLWVYLPASFLGLVPRTALVTLAAARAERLDFNAGESWWVLGAGLTATAVCVGVVAHLGRRALDRATRISSPPASA
jgi:uncharacterized membrane protein YdjX (TVP38/TMEM64 family)